MPRRHIGGMRVLSFTLAPIWQGGWAHPGAHLNTLMKRKIQPCWEQNPRHPANCQSKYWLSYASSPFTSPSDTRSKRRWICDVSLFFSPHIRVPFKNRTYKERGKRKAGHNEEKTDRPTSTSDVKVKLQKIHKYAFTVGWRFQCICVWNSGNESKLPSKLQHILNAKTHFKCECNEIQNWSDISHWK